LVSLHIFEQKYRDLLADLESNNLTFGILYANDDNPEYLGGLVQLDKVVKRYPTGESDIIVRCMGTFKLIKFFENYQDRLYAGGEIIELDISDGEPVDTSLKALYNDYHQTLRGYKLTDITLDYVANNMGLHLSDKVKYLSLGTMQKRQKFLKTRIKFQKFLLEQEKKSSGSFHLN